MAIGEDAQMDLDEDEENATMLAFVRVRLASGVYRSAIKFCHDVLQRLYREAYAGEAFIRLIQERRGLYRFPEPKLLAGTNYCDIGLTVDPSSGRAVIVSALDNLVKGAAGSAVQCMNLMMGWEENAGLTFAGLHP